jgi:hypothetical protein
LKRNLFLNRNVFIKNYKMADRVNLNLLKNEIDNRKREKNQISTNPNGVFTTTPTRDEFLSGLLESFQTGRDTHSSVLIKEVVNKAAEKIGEPAPMRNTPVLPISNSSPQPHRISNVDMSIEREEQLYIDLERKRKSTVIESIEGFNKTPQVGAPMNNYQPQSAPMQLNEAYLTENVKKIVNNYLIENFGPVVEEAIKSTILEMYAVERIKEVLQENKELVRTVVYEVFKEIREKQNAKKV